MSCVIRYADAHRPDLMIVENVVEAAKWGPNRNGETFRWWLGQLDNLGYRTRPLMLNSAAFGVPQMRDRMFVICWRKTMRTPDLRAPRRRLVPALRHRRRGPPGVPRTAPTPGRSPSGASSASSTTTGAAAATRSPTSPTRRPRPSSTGPTSAPASVTVTSPLAVNTLARIQRGIDAHGGRLPHISDYQSTGTPITSPVSTLTTAETHALVAGLQVVAAGNTFERDGSTCRIRTLNEPTWTQHTTASVGIATHAGTGRPVPPAHRPHPPRRADLHADRPAAAGARALGAARRGDVRQEQRRPRRHRLPPRRRPVRHHDHPRHDLARLARPRPARRPRRGAVPDAQDHRDRPHA